MSRQAAAQRAKPKGAQQGPGRIPLEPLTKALRRLPNRLMMKPPAPEPLFKHKSSREQERFAVLVGFSVCGSLFFLTTAVLALRGAITSLGPWTLPAYGWLDLLGLAFLATAAPLAVYFTLEERRIQNLEERLPDLLTDIAALHRAGMTLTEALKVAARGHYGALTPEVQHVADQIRWNVPVLDALEEFRARVRTPLVERTMTVVIEAGHSGGNITEVLELAAGNARAVSALRRQRKSEMALYVSIIYVAFAVFLAVIASLQGLFVPKMVTAVSAASSMGSGPLGRKGTPSIGEFRGLFLVTVLIQAVSNGFVGGMMGEGRLRAGLKHAAVMVAIGLVAFAVI